jgi:hypothetical protein
MLHERWGAWSVKGVALDGVGIGVDIRLAAAGARPIAASSECSRWPAGCWGAANGKYTPDHKHIDETRQTTGEARRERRSAADHVGRAFGAAAPSLPSATCGGG